MAITIIVEDGSGVSGANSYVDLDTARAYAADRGRVLPVDDEAAKALIIRSMDYLESFRAKFQGSKTLASNPLSWPRQCVVLDGEDWPDDEIPSLLTAAQNQIIIEAASTELMPTVTGAFVTREKVGPIETEYSAAVSTSGQPSMPAVDALLEPLLSVGSFRLRTVRA